MHLAPPLPVAPIEAVALALTYAGLQLGETATSFRINPVPENYDELLAAMRLLKAAIAEAEKQWGIEI